MPFTPEQVAEFSDELLRELRQSGIDYAQPVGRSRPIDIISALEAARRDKYACRQTHSSLAHRANARRQARFIQRSARAVDLRGSARKLDSAFRPDHVQPHAHPNNNILTEDQQWAKLKMIVEVAREVWH